VSTAIKLSSPATREFWEIPVLFEDDHLLALDKPGGLLTTPDQAEPSRPDLMALLHAGIAEKKPWARERHLEYLSHAQRLDAEITGVLLLAKNKPALLALADSFGNEKGIKKFLALVHGEPAENQFETDLKLSPHPVKIGLMCADAQNGRKAKTRFEVLENFPRGGYALLKCDPLTGRTDQVRAHLRHAGLPVVGDQLYGGKPLWLSRLKKDYRLKPGKEERALLARVALHVAELIFPHPVTGETVTIKSEWPKDLKVAMKYLRQYAK
jgi:RluA family pseudouridine synthase